MIKLETDKQGWFWLIGLNKFSHPSKPASVTFELPRVVFRKKQRVDGWMLNNKCYFAIRVHRE